MIKIGQAYIYRGNDLNFRNMKCITHGRYENGVKVSFFDEIFGKVEAIINPKDLQVFM